MKDGLKAMQRKAGARSEATLTGDKDEESEVGGADGGGQRVVESRVTVAVDIR